MPTRDLASARKAYKEKDVDLSKKAHDTKFAEEKHKQGKYLKNIVYGGLDGIITTFAVVAGVMGASLSSGIIIIMGFANLLGDGISMAIGDYLSSKAENEYAKSERERESWEVENYPEGEKKEMLEIYKSKGINEEDAEKVVSVISKHKEAWVDLMMLEELGITPGEESPTKAALATFASFLIFGFLPLVTFVLAIFIPAMTNASFTIAIILTALTIFTLGALKVRVTGKNWFMSGIEMLLVGGLAAAAAYLIGFLLKGLGG